MPWLLRNSKVPVSSGVERADLRVDFRLELVTLAFE